MEFVGKKVRKPAAKPGSQPNLSIGGPDGLNALAEPGITWTTRINISRREDIVQQYKQMQPAELDGLKEWIRNAKNSANVVRSITIACFAPSDPMVYYFIDRTDDRPVIMAVYWNKDRQEWIVAASAERLQAPEKFDETHHIIETVACSTIQFR